MRERRGTPEDTAVRAGVPARAVIRTGELALWLDILHTDRAELVPAWRSPLEGLRGR